MERRRDFLKLSLRLIGPGAIWTRMSRDAHAASESGRLNCSNRRVKLGAMHKESCDMMGEMMGNY